MAQVVEEPILHICIEMHERVMYFTLLPCFFFWQQLQSPAHRWVWVQALPGCYFPAGAFSSIHADLGQKSGNGKMLRQEDWSLKNIFRFQTVLFLSIKEFSRHIFYVCGYISRCIKIHTSVFNKSVPWSKHLPDNILKILGFIFSQTGLFRETKESAWQDYGVASIHFLYSCG